MEAQSVNENNKAQDRLETAIRKEPDKPGHVLILGGTGRTGRRVIDQLLERGFEVRAVVRSVKRLPEGIVSRDRLTLIEAELLSLSQKDLLDQVRGCVAVISCLGHTTDLKGIFGPPRDLVTRATERVCRAIAEIQPPSPVKFVLMSSVSVNRPGRLDSRRGMIERAFVKMLRGLVPPSRDNQEAADFLNNGVGRADPFVQWVIVRPDTLVDGDIGSYALHEGLVSSLAKPDQSAMSNVAHFMCELVSEPKTWDEWKGRLPVIIDAGSI
jgi:hypothetical protein